MSGKVFSHGQTNPLNRPMPNLSGGACVGHDPALFFPAAHDVQTLRTAVAICNGCPVMHTCRDYAVDTRQQEGIWGGTSARERRALRRRKLRLLEKG